MTIKPARTVGVGPVAVLLGSSQVVRFLATGAVMALLARTYDNIELSRYFLAMAALATATSIGIWGTDSLAVMTLREGTRDQRSVLRTTIAVRLLVTALSLGPCLLVLGASMRRSSDLHLWSAYVAVTALVQAFEAVDLRRRAFNDSWPIVVRTAMFLIATVLRVILVVLHRLELPHLLAITVVESAIGSLITAKWCRGHSVATGGQCLGGVEGTLVRHYLRRGAPLAMSFFAYFVYARFDQFILGRYGREGSVAAYSLATTIFEFGIVVLVSLAQAMFPSLVSTYESDPARFWRNSAALTELALGLSIVLALGVSVGSFLAPVFLGSSYRAVPLLTFLQAPGLVFIALSSVRSTYFLANGRQKELAASTAVSACLSVAANLLLVPFFDAYASAIICTAIQCFSLVLFNALTETGRSLLRFQVGVVTSGRWLRPDRLAIDLRRRTRGGELTHFA
jgi:O-antigen/teichoic acid export membrane protein